MFLIDRPALAGIWVYQRFLSRRKGYRCAYSVLHGGTGCSGYVKYAIRDHGLFGALPAIRQRFRDCRSAATTLTRQRCAARAALRDTADEGQDGQQDDAQDGERHRKPREDRHARKKECCGELACGGCEAGSFGCCSASSAASSAGADAVGSAASSGASACDCGFCDCSPSCG